MADILDGIKQLLGEEIEIRLRAVLGELRLAPQPEIKKPAEQGWVTIEEAKKIVPIKSKKKWKELRDSGELDFARVGKGFIYDINSLRHYILKHSSKTKFKRYEKGKG